MDTLIASYKSKTQAEILEEIREKSRLIVMQQRKADLGEFTSYGGAIGLQRLRNERKALQSLLKPLELVIDNG